MKPPGFPKEWDERRVSDLLAHYELQSEEEAAAEDEIIWLDPEQTVMEIPSRFVPEGHEFIAKYEGDV